MPRKLRYDPGLPGPLEPIMVDGEPMEWPWDRRERWQREDKALDRLSRHMSEEAWLRLERAHHKKRWAEEVRLDAAETMADILDESKWRARVALVDGYMRKERWLIENQLSRASGEITVEQWEAILEAFGFKCAYCGKRPRMLNIEHVVPVRAGGKTDANNILPSCGKCNRLKCNDNVWDFVAAHPKRCEKFVARVFKASAVWL